LLVFLGQYVRCAECENLVWYDEDFYFDEVTVLELRTLTASSASAAVVEKLLARRTLVGLLEAWPWFPVGEPR
jgi:hypothetical protein